MRQTNVAAHLVVLGFLSELSASTQAMSGSTREQARNGNLRIKDSEVYVRAYIGGAAANYDVLDNTVDRATGICNVNRGVLPDNQMQVIEEISILGALGDNATSAGAVAYNEDVANAVKNADFVVMQNGREVINIPAARIINTGAVPTSVNDLCYKLKSFAYLNDGEYFTVGFRFPNGVSVPAGTGAGTFPYIEVRLGGHKTEKRSS
jgi:hypothetical protein